MPKWYNFLIGFSYASGASVLAPIGCYFLNKRKDALRKTLFVLLLISLASDIGNEIYIRSGFKGYLIINVFYATQVSLLMLIYRSLLPDKKLISLSLLFFILLFTFYTIFIQSIHNYQSSMLLIECIIMITLSISYYLEMYRYLPTESLLRYFPGWINMAVFYYFTFNLFLFITAEYVFKNASTEVSIAFWCFHDFNNIIKNCLFAAALFVSKKEHTSSYQL